MLQFDIWLQDEFVNAKNNIKQRNCNTVCAQISKPISPTSDSFLLIMSHIEIEFYIVKLKMYICLYQRFVQQQITDGN